jgi:hypothetical protein
MVIVSNRDAFVARYGSAGFLIAGEYGGQLNNAGETLRLEDSNSAEIQAFTYDDTGPGWHVTTDGDGFSLVILDPQLPLATWGTPDGWRPSCEVNGSPNQADILWADFDSDSDVDLGDLVVLQAHLGMTGAVTRADGDLNRDGAIDRTDVNQFVAGLGRVCPLPPSPSPAPAADFVGSNSGSRRGINLSTTRAMALRTTVLRSDTVDHVIGGDSSRESFPPRLKVLPARRRLPTTRSASEPTLP